MSAPTSSGGRLWNLTMAGSPKAPHNLDLGYYQASENKGGKSLKRETSAAGVLLSSQHHHHPTTLPGPGCYNSFAYVSLPHAPLEGPSRHHWGSGFRT